MSSPPTGELDDLERDLACSLSSNRLPSRACKMPMSPTPPTSAMLLTQPTRTRPLANVQPRNHGAPVKERDDALAQKADDLQASKARINVRNHPRRDGQRQATARSSPLPKPGHPSPRARFQVPSRTTEPTPSRTSITRLGTHTTGTL